MRLWVRERQSEKYLQAPTASQSLSCCGLGSGVPCVGVAACSPRWSTSSSSRHSVSVIPHLCLHGSVRFLLLGSVGVARAVGGGWLGGVYRMVRRRIWWLIVEVDWGFFIFALLVTVACVFLFCRLCVVYLYFFFFLGLVLVCLVYWIMNFYYLFFLPLWIYIFFSLPSKYFFMYIDKKILLGIQIYIYIQSKKGIQIYIFVMYMYNFFLLVFFFFFYV